MLTPDRLVVNNCYFFVFIKKRYIPVIKSLIYKGKNLDGNPDSTNNSEYFFEDADDGCFTPPSKKARLPITMDEELLMSLMDLEELIKFLEDIRDGVRMI